MKNQKRLVFGLITVLVVVVFALLNTDPTSINFGFTHLDVPLILLIVILLLIGAGVAFLIGRGESGSASKENVERQLAEQKVAITTQLKKEQEESEQELKKQVLKLTSTNKSLQEKLTASEKLIDNSNSQNQ